MTLFARYILSCVATLLLGAGVAFWNGFGHDRVAVAANDRARTLLQLGAYDEAIRELDRAIDIEPAYAEPWSNRGFAYARKGDDMRALADYNHAIALDPKEAAVFNNRGNVWYRRGSMDKALADYEQALSLKPRDANALYSRGQVREKLGDKDGGAADEAAAKAIDPRVGA